MQKQHLHALLLVLGCCFGAGCGEPNLGLLNPYLHGKQELTTVLPDTGKCDIAIFGWTFLAPGLRGELPGGVQVLSPDGKLVTFAWTSGDGLAPIQFSKPVRSLYGVSASNPALGLTLSMKLAENGRMLVCQLHGRTGGEITSRIAIDVGGYKLRGLMAEEELWTPNKNGMAVALPWGDSWQIESSGAITPLPKLQSEVVAEVSFSGGVTHEVTLAWSSGPSIRKIRRLDIDTESMSADQSLAYLIASIPPARAMLPTEEVELEDNADLAFAQWLVHSEFAPGYLSVLESPEEQVFHLVHSVSAYQTLYSWGALNGEEILDREPLLDAAMSRVDTTSREIARGATIEDRFREATVWTFAEQNLATDNPARRNVYRAQASTALNDAQNELKKRLRLWRKENTSRNDTLALYERFVGSDSASQRTTAEPFVAPDSLAILRIVGRASLAWLSEVSPQWHELQRVPWPIEMEQMRFHFSQNLKNRVSGHWAKAQETILDPCHLGVFPEEIFDADPQLSAAAEIETVVQTYLGLRPRWREKSVTFDARLPEGWGRTKARVPFEEGELYVDYDFAHQRAWVAAAGLTETYTCQIYMPTPSGAISGQFKLEPGDSPRLITLVVDPGNKHRLRIESDGLPE